MNLKQGTSLEGESSNLLEDRGKPRQLIDAEKGGNRSLL